MSKRGVPHDTVAYARIRIRNLRDRIAGCEKLSPGDRYDARYTVAERIILDYKTLARWVRRLEQYEQEGK